MTGPGLHVVLPGTVDDPNAPSGGNTYDRRLCRELTAQGWAVREHAVAGAWPHPGTVARAALTAALAATPDGAVALIDGLVACAAPDVVIPEADRLRVVVLVHLPLADETGRGEAEAAELAARERATLRAAAAVVATSSAARGRLIDRHGLPPTRVHVAPPGVDPAPPAPGSDAGTRLLCVASVTPRKGHDVLIQALATLTDLPWSLVCVGGLTGAPDHVAAVRRLIDRFALGGRVLLAGTRTGPALAATYAEADLVVLPSHAETYGMVVTEALACGIPVLASAVDGVPEALGRPPGGEVPGVLVPPDDPGALASALRRWLHDPGLRYRLRTAARARRKTLRGWAYTAHDVANVLEGVGMGARA